jgi:hypothetical protein
MRPPVQRILRRWLLPVVLAVLLATGITGRAALANDKCSEIFAGGLAAEVADAKHPSVGVIYAGQAYYLQTPGATRKVATRPDLEALLLASLASQATGKTSIEIYFQGLNHRDAFNLISTIRLKSTVESGRIEAYAAENTPPPPTAASGGNGNGEPPGTGNASPARAPGPGPKPGGGGVDSGGGADGGKETDDAGETRPWLAAFPRLNSRYDWRRAEVREESRPRRFTPPADFDPLPTAFSVVIPIAEKPRFSVLTFFKKDAVRAPSEAIATSIKAVLRDEDLRRATVQRAAREVIRRLDRDHADSKSVVRDTLDMMIVLIDDHVRG